MSIKSKIFAAAATLTMVGGIGAAGTLAANAAAPSCGHNCINIFSREFGTRKHPNFVLDVYQQKAAAGQPIILWAASNHDPAEDFTVSFQGTVNDFYKAGLVSAALNLHYSKFWAYEIQYSPNGVGEQPTASASGARPPMSRRVALEPCGQVRQDRVGGGLLRHDQGLLRSADQRLGHQLLPPVRAQLPGRRRVPDRQAAPQLTTWTLSKYSNGTVFDNQMWSADFGVLP